MVLLGNLAVRTTTALEVDPQSGNVTGAEIPEEYLKPTYRDGWTL